MLGQPVVLMAFVLIETKHRDAVFLMYPYVALGGGSLY